LSNSEREKLWLQVFDVKLNLNLRIWIEQFPNFNISYAIFS
jgi:hypothetical protein